MITEENQTTDWRNTLQETFPYYKIADKEILQVTFLDEGRITAGEYGTGVTFTIMKTGNQEKYAWFVSANNYPTLKQLRDLGKLTGTVVEIKREGSNKNDTKYHITKTPL